VAEDQYENSAAIFRLAMYSTVVAFMRPQMMARCSGEPLKVATSAGRAHSFLSPLEGMEITMHFFLMLALGLLAGNALGQTPVMVVQADRWCPYNCEPGTKAPGYVVEILQKVFELDGVKLNYQVTPWDRAIKNAREGKAAAVIGASANEARERNLLIGKEPVGFASDCLYVAHSNPLRYQTATDLDGLRSVAVVSGYTYAAGLGDWVVDPKNKSRIVMSHGDEPNVANLRNLARGLIDGVIDEAAVLKMMANDLGVSDKVRLAGCTGREAVFVAFSKRFPDAQSKAAQLDRGLVDMRKNGSLRTLLKAYGQSDWK
jgi:polar amino acid transport system substrate-binding protein